MKYLLTIDVTPAQSADPASLASDITAAVAASVQAIPAVQSVGVSALQSEAE